MAKHTAGPWRTETVNAGHANPSIIALGIVGVDNTIVARMPAEYRPTHAVWPLCDANAALIASAPELLEALKDAEPYCPVFVQDEIRRAIAKAEGR